MVRAAFFGDVFIPQQRSVKAEIKMKSKEYQAVQYALLDSGSTHSFISPHLINRYQIPRIKINRPKPIRNIDGSRNSIGMVTHEVKLEIQYGAYKGLHTFYEINLGGNDSIILGYPFLAATNPPIDWKKGVFYGHTTISTADAHLWTPRNQMRTLNKSAIDEQNDPGYEYDPRFIPHNDRYAIKNPMTIIASRARRTTMATQLAVQAADKRVKTWQEQIPRQYHKYGNVFSETEAQRFPKPRLWDHAIDLLPDAPITIDCKIYPLAPMEQSAMDDFLKEQLKKGYIRPSKSPYASSFFFVKKKDGKLRPTQDYRDLNSWTIPNKYPLPLIKDIIARLTDKKYFTKFDVRWGYNNVRIKEGDQWKAAFKTNRGLYEPRVMFFGLTNSPATFQMMMDAIFRQEMATGDVFVYMDDILIATNGTLQQHEQQVAHVLDVLLKHDLYLKPEKCSFHKTEMEYLGVIIGNGQTKMDPIKVKGLTDWPTPKKVKDVRSFLGFGNYYKDFIDNYSFLARPLHDLTKKDRRWSWDNRENDSFNTLKEKFTSYPVLRDPDQTKKFIMDCDASAFAIGAVLSHDFKDGRHPVGFYSKSLNPTEQRYPIYERELLAIICALKAFRYLLLGARQKILIRTDHNNLKYFKDPRKINIRLAGWIELLADYDFELQHLPGTDNTIADILSRRADFEEGVKIDENVTILPNHLWTNHILLRRAIIDRLKERTTYLIDNIAIRRKVLQQIHDTPVGGHPGIANTWNLVSRHYHGPRLRKFVEDYVKGCAKCQESKPKTTLKRAPLQPFDTHVEEGPFQYVSMDLITDLPKSGRYDSILTIVDQGCSKAAKFIPCTKTIDGDGVAQMYLKHLFPWFGTPKRIISDRDPRFASHFSRAICKATDIQQNLSTAFHPRTDGQTERMNQWIETYLRSFVNGQQNNWSTLLPVAEFAHNTWKHEGTKKAPHELIMGIVPSAKLMPLNDSIPTAQARISELSKARSDAQHTLEKRIKFTKAPRELHINQKVWLEARNLSVKSPSRKLTPRRYGPFSVIKKISPVAYQIKLPETMKIHDVFHIDLLIPFNHTESYGRAYTQPPPELIEGEEEYEVEDIISDRMFGRSKKKQYLIKWKGYPYSENSWVNAKDLHAPEILSRYNDSTPRGRSHK